MKISRLAVTAFAFAILVVVLDQLTKAWILSGLDLREAGRVEVLPPILNFTWVENRGVSFGLFGDGSARWMLAIAEERVKDALAVGAEIIVSGCAACKDNLKKGTKAIPKEQRGKLKIMDITEIVANAVE